MNVIKQASYLWRILARVNVLWRCNLGSVWYIVMSTKKQFLRCDPIVSSRPNNTVSKEGDKVYAFQIMVSWSTPISVIIQMYWCIRNDSDYNNSNHQIRLLPWQYTLWWRAYTHTLHSNGGVEASGYWSPIPIKMLLQLLMVIFQTKTI